MASRREVHEKLVIQGDYKVTFNESNEDVKYIQYNEIEDIVLTGHSSGTIKVYKEDKFQWEFGDVDVVDVPITSMKHRPLSKNYPVTNTVICSYYNGVLKSWNYNFKSCVFTITEERKIASITYHPKLAKFITMGDNTKIYLYDEDSKRQERVLTCSNEPNSKDGHKSTVVCASFHPKSGNELITGGLDNTIHFWDTRQPHSVRCIEGIRLAGEGIDFNDKGTEFLTCSSDKDKSLRIWDYGSGKEIKIMEPDKHKSVNRSRIRVINETEIKLILAEIPRFNPSNLEKSAISFVVATFCMIRRTNYLTCGRYINPKMIVCAGGEPNLVRIVDLNTYQTVGLVSGMLKPVSNVDVADEANKIDVIFGAGKKMYHLVPST